MSKDLVEIKGFGQLQKKLTKLSDNVKKKELQKLLSQSAKVTVRQAQFNAPLRSYKRKDKPPGTLKKSIGVIKGKKGFAKENPVVYVGPRAKRGFKGWYGHIIEYGRNIYRKGFKRDRKKGANSSAAVKRVKANPFMAKAYKGTKGKVTADAVRNIERYLQRQIKRLSK